MTFQQKTRIVLLVVFSLIAFSYPSHVSASTTSSKAKTFKMPNIIGFTYETASKKLKPFGKYLYSIDVLENRSVGFGSDWKVVRQSPSPGTRVAQDDKVCAGVLKLSEDWRTPKQFGCWAEIPDEVRPKTFTNSLFMTIDYRNTLSATFQYRATVQIQTDDGRKLKVMFCTERAVASGSKVGRMRLSGKYFLRDTLAFNSYSGTFKWSISKFERQFGKRPC